MILIAGAYPNDSGKTSLALAVIRRLREAGVDVGAFKPLAGHSLWWQHESYVKSLRMSSLFGMDAYRLWRAVGGAVPIEVLNPADVLISVPMLSGSGSPSPGPGGFEWFVVGRFTLCEDGLKHLVYLRGPGLPRVLGAGELVDKLVRRAWRVVNVNSFEEYLELHRSYYFRAVDTCYSAVERRFGEVVVESFNDSVYPWRGVEKADLVAVVAPPEVHLYRPGEFFSAVRSMGDPYTKTFGDVFRAVRPFRVIRIQPVAQPTPRRVARAYEGAAGEIARIVLG